MRTYALNEMERRHQDDARRQSPVERAILFLRSRGHFIHRMDVEGGRADLWACDAAKNVSAEQLLAKAAAKGFEVAS